jgi:hypothetical protein
VYSFPLYRFCLYHCCQSPQQVLRLCLLHHYNELSVILRHSKPRLHTFPKVPAVIGDHSESGLNTRWRQGQVCLCPSTTAWGRRGKLNEPSCVLDFSTSGMEFLVSRFGRLLSIGHRRENLVMKFTCLFLNLESLCSWFTAGTLGKRCM